MLTLLAPAGEVGSIGDAMIPADIYFLAREPVALVGMGYPARVDWQLLYEAGVHHVVCLTHDDAPPYDCTPLRYTAIALEDLYATPAGPRDPSREQQRVGAAAQAVVDAIGRGEGVAVHCRGGRGRTGSVLGVALTRLGHQPLQVVDYLDAVHRVRGKDGWPEAPWQRDVVMGRA